MRFMTAMFKLHTVGQQPDDHIDHYTYQRAQPGFIVGLSDDVEADRVMVIHQVMDAEFRFADIFSHYRVTVERQIGFGGRKYAACLLFRTIQHIAPGGGNGRMWCAITVFIDRHFLP